MNLLEKFGENVFNQKVMKERLPKEIFKSLKKTIEAGEVLDPNVADVVANAMKDWALEKGATHYTHWFQPLTGLTAEKHDSFLSPTAEGMIISEFSGKQLIQGEPDASSFPSGGLRATFEARGYTAWDATSPAFLKEDATGYKTLCIPTAFCSYTGEALDKKTPLLRSNEAVAKQALRLLRALGRKNSVNVTATVGPEQEYFLIDRKYFEERMDLLLTGRTLFGAAPAKGQELEDQYFGALKDKISVFMTDLDVELWKMGITSKTKHNEVAPAQYEMAPVFSVVNIATDHNQLVMETLQKVALRHDLVCLLHEKPFSGINGSGKHNNWSLASDDGINFLDPGHTPAENEIFMLTLAALMKGVDIHADILRATASGAGNDHRLGANEAPPAIISIFVGDELIKVLEHIEKGEAGKGAGKNFLTLGVDTLPALPKDNSDRNRTSPFAFTGNKFEFRMVGSSASIAGPNVALNTIVAEVFDEFATRLEKASNVNTEATKIVQEVIKNHKRIIFNGNGYDEAWVKEAEKRGLPNLKSTPEALQAYTTDKAAKLFEKYKVLTHQELESRYDIYMEQYSAKRNIEGKVGVEMIKTQYLPAGFLFASELADSIGKIKAVDASLAKPQEKLLKEVSGLLACIQQKVEKLQVGLAKAQSEGDVTKKAYLYRDEVFASLEDVRLDVDKLETLTPKYLWPVASFAEVLFLSSH